MPKTIRYSLTFLGEVEVDDTFDTTDQEMVKDKICSDYYERGFDFDNVNDVELEVI